MDLRQIDTAVRPFANEVDKSIIRELVLDAFLSHTRANRLLLLNSHVMRACLSFGHLSPSRSGRWIQHIR